MPTATLSIDSIRIVQVTDTDPDFSHLGEYTDDISKFAIDRRSGKYVDELEREALEANYREACEALEARIRADHPGVAIRFEDREDSIANLQVVCSWVDDEGEEGEAWESIEQWEAPERGREYRFFVPYAGGEKPGSADYRKYGLQDYARCEAYNNQQWWYVGVYAIATISVNGEHEYEIKSPGSGGIESDSDDEYFAEIGEDEFDQLAEMLANEGFSTEEIEEVKPESFAPVY